METISRDTAAGQGTPRTPFGSLPHVALVTADSAQEVLCPPAPGTRLTAPALDDPAHAY